MKTLILIGMLLVAACGKAESIVAAPPPDSCASFCAELSVAWGAPTVGGTCCIDNTQPICVCLTDNSKYAADPCAVLDDPEWNPLHLCRE